MLLQFLYRHLTLRGRCRDSSTTEGLLARSSYVTWDAVLAAYFSQFRHPASSLTHHQPVSGARRRGDPQPTQHTGSPFAAGTLRHSWATFDRSPIRSRGLSSCIHNGMPASWRLCWAPPLRHEQMIHLKRDDRLTFSGLRHALWQERQLVARLVVQWLNSKPPVNLQYAKGSLRFTCECVTVVCSAVLIA